MLFVKRMSVKNLLCKLRGGETAANKPRTRRSLVSASGSLFIEAAIIAPVAFVGLLGAIEVMNLYLQRGSVINVANSIAMAIQQNPDITAQEMYEFQKSLGGGVTPFKEIKISDGSPYTRTTPCSVRDCRVAGLDIRIGASTTPVKEPDIRNLAPSDWSSPHVGKLAGRENPAWPNAASPLKADPNQSAADDANAYYVGVRVAWQNRPIFTRLGFGSVTTTQFAGVVVKPPVSMECPGGQMIKGFVGGVPRCDLQVKIDQSCPAGQVVSGFSNGQALCVVDQTSSGAAAPAPAPVAQPAPNPVAQPAPAPKGCRQKGAVLTCGCWGSCFASGPAITAQCLNHGYSNSDLRYGWTCRSKDNSSQGGTSCSITCNNGTYTRVCQLPGGPKSDTYYDPC